MKQRSVLSFCAMWAAVGILVAEAAPIEVRVGTVAPTGTPWTDALEDIKKRVQQESGGEIRLKVFPGGQLGGELEILQGLRRNRIQMAGLTNTTLATVVPELDVLEIPYLFKSSAEADAVLDRHLFEWFKKRLADKGLVLVAWAENGWRSVGTKDKRVSTPEDLKGLKVRSQESKVHLAFWKRMGANPVPLAIPEVLASLQTGLIKGFDNTALFTLAAEWHTGIRHYTVTDHIYQSAAIVLSKAFWDGLSDTQKKILMGDGNALAPRYRKAVRALGDELLGVLAQSKVEVTQLTDVQKKAFRDRCAGMDVEVTKLLGGDSAQVLQKIREAQALFAQGK